MKLIDVVLSFAPFIFFSLSVFFGRNYLLNFIAKRMEYKFGSKLERLKSELRYAENEAETLRRNLLESSSVRGKFLYERKVLSAERLWAEAIKLSSLMMYSQMTIHFDFEYIKKFDDGGIKFNEFIEKVKNFENETGLSKGIELERIFVSKMAWAIFSAYKSVILDGYTRLKMLEAEIFDVQKYMKVDKTIELLKQLFPDESHYIDEKREKCFPIMLDDLLQLLFDELQSVVLGLQEDAETSQRAEQILMKAREIKITAEAR